MNPNIKMKQICIQLANEKRFLFFRQIYIDLIARIKAKLIISSLLDRSQNRIDRDVGKAIIVSALPELLSKTLLSVFCWRLPQQHNPAFKPETKHAMNSKDRINLIEDFITTYFNGSSLLRFLSFSKKGTRWINA